MPRQGEGSDYRWGGQQPAKWAPEPRGPGDVDTVAGLRSQGSRVMLPQWGLRSQWGIRVMAAHWDPEPREGSGMVGLGFTDMNIEF